MNETAFKSRFYVQLLIDLHLDILLKDLMTIMEVEGQEILNPDDDISFHKSDIS